MNLNPWKGKSRLMKVWIFLLFDHLTPLDIFWYNVHWWEMASFLCELNIKQLCVNWYNSLTRISDKLGYWLPQFLFILFKFIIIRILVFNKIWIFNHNRKHIWLVFDWRFKSIYVLHNLHHLILHSIIVILPSDINTIVSLMELHGCLIVNQG